LDDINKVALESYVKYIKTTFIFVRRITCLDYKLQRSGA